MISRPLYSEHSLNKCIKILPGDGKAEKTTPFPWVSKSSNSSASSEVRSSRQGKPKGKGKLLSHQSHFRPKETEGSFPQCLGRALQGLPGLLHLSRSLLLTFHIRALALRLPAQTAGFQHFLASQVNIAFNRTQIALCPKSLVRPYPVPFRS